MERRFVNLGRIDLVSLNLVLSCAREGSLSRAGRSVHLSITAASGRLRRLEEALGQRLFHRHRRGLEPTAAGLLVIEAGRTAMNTLERMVIDLCSTGAETLRQEANTGRHAKALPIERVPSFGSKRRRGPFHQLWQLTPDEPVGSQHSRPCTLDSVSLVRSRSACAADMSSPPAPSSPP